MSQSIAPALEHTYDTPGAAARALSQNCCQAFRATLTYKSTFHLALSGGSSPVPFLQALAQDLVQAQLPTPQLCLWWCDERSVPPDHPDSNYKLVEEHLLLPLAAQGAPRPMIERMQGEAPSLEAEAARYAQRLAGIGALDYTVLGMGSDGHTASLFPGSSEPDERCFVSQHPEGSQRLTLSSDFLCQSQHRALLWYGPEKVKTWQAAQASGNTLKYPILRIQQAGNLNVFRSD